MIQLSLKYAFEIYGANTACLGVFANNMNAYHCYKRIGFQENGEYVDYEINGEIWKGIEMEIKPDDN